MMRSVTELSTLNARMSTLFPGVAHGGEWRRISRRTDLDMLDEIFGCIICKDVMRRD
jgi:hypothetical protein